MRKGPPDVTDDIAEIWNQTIDLTPKQVAVKIQNSTSATRNFSSKLNYGNLMKSEPLRAGSVNKIDKQDRKSIRSNSNASEIGKEKQRVLKIGDDNRYFVAQRERFNEDTKQTIQEALKPTAQGLTMKNLSSQKSG